MTNFILAIYFETVNLECFTAIVGDDELETFMASKRGLDPVFCFIYVLYYFPNDCEGGKECKDCNERVLLVPDLSRFYNLEVVWIEFNGKVKTSSPAGSLILPNRVWMFSIENGNLCSNLTFGYHEYDRLTSMWIICFLRHNLPKAIVDMICSYWGEGVGKTVSPQAFLVLKDATISGSVNWKTSEGENGHDMSMLIATRGKCDLPNLLSAVNDITMDSVDYGHDLRCGRPLDHIEDPPEWMEMDYCDDDPYERIYQMRTGLTSYCENVLKSRMDLLSIMSHDTGVPPGIDKLLDTFFKSWVPKI
jgi:hypothetical protein